MARLTDIGTFVLRRQPRTGSPEPGQEISLKNAPVWEMRSKIAAGNLTFGQMILTAQKKFPAGSPGRAPRSGKICLDNSFGFQENQLVGLG